MRKAIWLLLVFAVVAGATFGQCGTLVVNPTTGKLDCIGKPRSAGNCKVYTVNYTSFQSPFTSVTTTIAAMPANTAVTYLNVRESTQFAGTGNLSSATLKVSSDSGLDLTFPIAVMQAVTASNSYGFQSLPPTNGTWNLTATFTNTTASPSNLTNLTAGAAQVGICTAVLQ
jgi:hypothetical protein